MSRRQALGALAVAVLLGFAAGFVGAALDDQLGDGGRRSRGRR